MPTYEVTIYGTWVKTFHMHAQDMDEARAIWDRFNGEDARVELVQDTDLGEDDIECSTLSEEAPA